jgi:MoaA/NifB/PqqE/SkfB family radical SAM enzyme
MANPPHRLTVVTNPDECNLACSMCATHAPEARVARGSRPAPPRRLSLRQVIAALDGAPPSLAEVIPSTRGEPLLWGGLPGLLHACAGRGLRLNVTTNGTFPGGGAEWWARRLVPACIDVKVSWEAASPDVDRALMGGRDPERALQDLRTLVRVRDEAATAGSPRCAVSLQVAAREENLAELPGLVQLAAAEGLDRVKVNHLQVHFPSLEVSSLRGSPASALRWNAEVRASRRVADGSPRRGGGRVVLQNFLELPEDGSRPAPGACPFVGQEAWLEVDGRFLPCPAPAARRGALGEFGTLAEGTLAEAWEGEAWRELRAGWRDRAPCRDCAFRRPGGA